MPTLFSEAVLEQAIIDKFKDEGYDYVSGDDLHRELTDVLIEEDSDPESETGMLANKFFHSRDVRMLLLSATPYKMYSTPEEIDETRIDEHFTEFLSVMDFLNDDPDKEKNFLTVWKNYSVRLKEYSMGDTTILEAKDAAEDALYQSVCRTERVSESENADIIDDHEVKEPLKVLEQDITSYLQVQQLLDPSRFLAECYHPIACMNDHLSLREIQRAVREKITEKLDKYPSPVIGTPDRRWYYLAPMLLDGAEYAYKWMENGDKLSDYSDEEDERKRGQKGFKAHMDALMNLFLETHKEKFANLGKRPDDLLDVLTDMAIASPAVCIRRTYLAYTEEELLPSYLPSQLARIFLNRMNTPESTAAVELACGRKSDDAHWQNMLTYCKQGNLQAVFDEYAHLISSGLDHDAALLQNLHKQMTEAMDIRTTQYGIDTFSSFRSRMEGKKERPVNIRTHFAVAFTKGVGSESEADRKKTIRSAFNSPFRPFVLATTSIGQEGLDFHMYCRRIVHWNLPANPIDLEQREGRINRFECLAIRQNVAKRYGDIRFEKDIWNEMFEAAKQKEKTDGASDLIPYWGLQESEDMIKIERIVPMYPFSRDVLAYERLIKILSVYRLTLGQARQEELLEYLFKNCDDPAKLKKLFINLSPYYRKDEL